MLKTYILRTENIYIYTYIYIYINISEHIYIYHCLPTYYLKLNIFQSTINLAKNPELSRSTSSHQVVAEAHITPLLHMESTHRDTYKQIIILWHNQKQWLTIRNIKYSIILIYIYIYIYIIINNSNVLTPMLCWWPIPSRFRVNRIHASACWLNHHLGLSKK